MKQIKGKPARWQWITSLGLIVTGLLFLLPIFPDDIRDRMPELLAIPGFVVLLFLWRRKEKYEDLPLEEQRELDLEDRDERNQMIYEKAAWRCWQGETVLFCVAYLVLLLFWDKVPALSQLDYRIFSWFLPVYWIRILFFELVRWWLNRRY